jgi:Zn-dependent peptidase ImmA (M78 family)
MKMPGHPDELLKKLGITEPHEIDLGAIAYDNNAIVKIRDLSGCEARIVGKGNKCVISINSNSNTQRQRFSIAHELGHWMLHRGENFICRSEDIDNPQGSSKPKERQADNYAANLILPQFIISKHIKKFSKLDFETIRHIAQEFSTSLTATSIRIIEGNYFPALVIYHTQERRKWFKSSKDVPSRWFPKDNLEIESHAFDVLYGNKNDGPKQRRSPASAWFDRREANDYEVLEHTIRIGPDTLTIIELDNIDMLEDEHHEPLSDMTDIRFR